MAMVMKTWDCVDKIPNDYHCVFSNLNIYIYMVNWCTKNYPLQQYKNLHKLGALCDYDKKSKYKYI